MPLIEPPPPGIYPEVDAKTYHSWRAASFSRLRVLRDFSPQHLAASDAQDLRLESEELLKGQVVHMAVLEPIEFERKYAFLPRVDMRTKLGKAMLDEAIKKNPGKLMLPWTFEGDILEAR